MSGSGEGEEGGEAGSETHMQQSRDLRMEIDIREPVTPSKADSPPVKQVGQSLRREVIVG